MLTEKQIEAAAIEMVRCNRANASLIMSALRKALITDEEFADLFFKLDCNNMETFGKICAIMHSPPPDKRGAVGTIRIDKSNFNEAMKHLKRLFGENDDDGKGNGRG